MAELTEVRTDVGDRRARSRSSPRTPARVVAAVRELGLDVARRTSASRAGSRRSSASGPQRYAVIDVGTNSVKFHVGERRRRRRVATIVDRAEVTRLGEGLDETGRLEPEPMERTVAAIAAMADGGAASRCRGDRGGRHGRAADRRQQRGVRRRRCGPAAASRSRSSPARRRPARLPRGRAPGSASRHGSLVVFDTGGGSSQFTFGQRRRVDERFSVNVGAVRFTERFGLDGVVSRGRPAGGARRDRRRPRRASTGGRRPTRSSAWAARSRTSPPSSTGSPTYDPDVVQGTVLDRPRRSTGRSSSTATRSADERRAIVGLQPQARRGHPRRRVHRADRAGEARQRLAHRQRSRPAARRARRAVRNTKGAAQ